MEKAVDAATPFEHRTTVMAERGIAVEQQQVSFHGSTFTHLDALCHIAYQGQLEKCVLFQQSVSEAGGCSNLAITTFRDGIVTRGILLDIPRLKGVPYLDAGAKVYIEDVEAWEKKAGIKIGPGDAVFLRTGRWTRRAKMGPFANFAGFDASFSPFLKQRDIALIGSDAGLDAGNVPGFPLVVPTVVLVALGVNIFDNADLEALSETAARLNRWEFMLVAAPVRVTNGTGSPINPIAVFLSGVARPRSVRVFVCAAASWLVLASPSHGQTNTQLWGTLTLNWLRSDSALVRSRARTQSAGRGSRGCCRLGEPRRHAERRYAFRQWLDLVGELATGYTSQTDDRLVRAVAARRGAAAPDDTRVAHRPVEARAPLQASPRAP